MLKEYKKSYYFMLLSLLTIPIIGVFLISSTWNKSKLYYQYIALYSSILVLILTLILFFLFNFNSNEFQHTDNFSENIQIFNLHLSIDTISLYLILLTAIIIPVALVSNWDSIKRNTKSYLIIILLLESLLSGVFLTSDIFFFYIYFESILPPLFLLIGLYGSYNKVRASYYIFIYTLWGSLFLLISILSIYSILGTTDYITLYRIDLNLTIQIFLFIGAFIAFAVKTPVIFLNNWLLKAHVESPLGGSIILAAIVLKLSIYGIFRLMLPVLEKACLDYTFIIYSIGVITILYASFSTLRTTDIKELIAYSSVSHAAVYLIGAFSNGLQGIEGSILLGIAHGFVSSALFISVGGILYDRSSTRNIYFYKGITQLMPLFSILFFILCLANCGAPLTLNFLGEFMSLYGMVEKLPSLSILASSSIILSAAYTIFMFNRISFGGVFTKLIYNENIFDTNKREFFLLLILVIFTIFLGIYPAIILDNLHYAVNSLIYKL